MARFLQEAARDMGQRIAASGGDGSKVESARELLSIMDRVRRGQLVATEDILRVAVLFRDELTLDNASRESLVLMARFFDINPYVPDMLLRFQLRAQIRRLKADDQQILWEGVDSLSKEELQEACRERGMRSMGLTDDGYRHQLRTWLYLSINRQVPASLLILSRAFTITAVKEDASRALVEAVSGLDPHVVSEAVLTAAGSDAAAVVSSSADKGEAPREPSSTAERSALRQMQLEVVRFQNRLIEAERVANEAMQKAREAQRLAAKKGTPKALHAAEAAMQRATIATREAATIAGEEHWRSPEHVHESVIGRVASTGGRADAGERADVEGGGGSASGPGAGTGSLDVDEDPLSMEDVRALEALASERALLRERTILSRVKTARMQMEATDMLSRGRIASQRNAKQSTVRGGGADSTTGGHEARGGRGSLVHDTASSVGSAAASAGTGAGGAGGVADGVGADEWEVPSAMDRVHASLDAMLDRLERELEETEQQLGDKLGVLDKDWDGVIPVVELEEAVKNILSNAKTDEAAAAVARRLDADGDGSVSIDDIVRYAEWRARTEKELLGDAIFDEGDDDM
jgi:hypothetical protein